MQTSSAADHMKPRIHDNDYDDKEDIEIGEQSGWSSIGY